MTRNDILKLFPEATKEQVDALLDIHSADIGQAKRDVDQLRADLKAQQDAVTTANATIAEMEKSKGDVAALQKQIDDYKAADEARRKAEAAAQARNALLARMDAALKGREFLFPRLKDMIADDFEKALADPANTGKSDGEIFEALTRDQGYFKSQAPGSGGEGGMPRPQDLGGGGDGMTRADFLKLDTSAQARYKQEHQGNFYNLFPELRQNS